MSWRVGIFCVSAFAAVTIAPVTQASLDDALAKFRAAVVRELKPGAKPPNDNRASQLAMLLARLQTDLDHQYWKEAAAQLNYFGDQERSPEMLELIHELRLEILKQSEALENAIIARIDATIKEAGQACSGARHPTAVDEAFRRLSELRPAEGLKSERLQAAYQKLNGAILFVARWQDYLMKSSAGTPKEAADVLQSILNDTKLYPMVDRSQLLERQNALKPSLPSEKASDEQAQTAAALVEATHSLEDLDELCEKLARFVGNDKKINALIQEIGILRNGYDEYRTGLYGAAFDHTVARSRSRADEQVQLLPLQQQLLFKLLPVYLNVDPSLIDASAANPSDCLLGLVKRARESHDWRLALRALETLQLIVYRLGPPPPWLAADIAGYSSLIAAINAETAGLQEQAADAYKKAFDSTGENLPFEWIAEKLKTLKLAKSVSSKAKKPRTR